VARVLVEADYHMKLVGMGLADGVAGVESYLDSVHMEKDQESLPLAVLRWWFSMAYRGVRSTPDADAYEIVGRGVQVLSENELLTDQGGRVHTGGAEPLTMKFAQDFTTHFDLLCQKYPLYTELRNIFDLALAVALIRSEDLHSRVDWRPDRLLDAERLRLPESTVPRQVDTVLNHRVINRRHVVVGVSGGVMIAPEDVLAKPREIEDYGQLTDGRRGIPPDLADNAWWWDYELELALK
jgi:hypothetical protein